MKDIFHLKNLVGALAVLVILGALYLAIREPDQFGARFFELCTVTVSGLLALTTPRNPNE